MPVEIQEGKVVVVNESGQRQEHDPEKLVEELNTLKTNLDGATVTIKVNGQPRTVTVADLKKMGEKVDAADERFRLAAAKEKTVEDMVRLRDLSTRLRTITDPRQVPDSDVLEYCHLSGMNDEQASQILAQFKAGQAAVTAQQAQQTDGTNGGGGDPQTAALLSQLQTQLQTVTTELNTMKAAQQTAANTEGEKNLRKQLRGLLTKDVLLGRIVTKGLKGDGDWEDQATMAGTLLNDAFRLVRDRVMFDGKPLTPDLLDEAVQSLRHKVKQFSIVAGGSDQAHTAVGPASGLDTSSLQVRQPLKRPRTSDPGYSDYLVDRLNRLVAQHTGA